MNRKGVSGPIAIVLLILIVVAAVGIIWITIMPVVKEDIDANPKTQVSIDSSGGYTLYDPTTKIACVQISREGEPLPTVEGLKIIFTVNGSSHSKTLNSSYVPEVNSKKTYCFDLASFGKPDSVEVIGLPQKSSGSGSSYISESEMISAPLSSEIFYLDGDYIELTNCMDLTEPGINKPGRYVLMSDLKASAELCLSILADDVTLDLNGHTIYGLGPTYAENVNLPYPPYFSTTYSYQHGGDRGIVITGDRVTLKSGAISNFSDAVVVNGNDFVLKDMNLSGNGCSGLDLVGDESSVTDLQANSLLGCSGGVGYGVSVEGSNNSFKNIDVSNCGAGNGKGVLIKSGNYNSFVNVTSYQYYSGNYGFYFSGGNHTSISNSKICGPANSYCFRCHSGTENFAEGNTYNCNGGSPGGSYVCDWLNPSVGIC